jgi:hypothetical protein
MVALERSSWAFPMSSWQVLPDGSGSWTEAERPAGAMLSEYRLVRQELPTDPAPAARLGEMMEGLPMPPPDTERCADFITDQPYGSLRLSKGAGALELVYNAGCRDEVYLVLLDRLRAADEVVAQRGRAAPATEESAAGL